MKIRYCMFALAAASLLMGACSKEHPFIPDNTSEGQVLKTALDVSASNENIQITRAASADYNLNDFNIAFVPDGNSTSLKSFKYGEMPDVVNLPAGKYTVTASYGEDRVAEWENPYFFGVSEVFEVAPMEITSFIEPIECSLQNIKVTVEYNSELLAMMGSDAYVEVKVGDNSGLNFSKSERRAGYFRHTEETTLVATFHGEINGANVVETKSYKGVQKGCWYKLTFKYHGPNGSALGAAAGSVSVDASVDVDDVNGDVTIADDEPLDDNERPGSGDDPTPPTPPDTGNDPQFIAVSSGLIFDTPWNVSGDTPCKFKAVSTAEGGFTELTCDIVSNSLTPSSLFDLGLSSHLDLVSGIRPEDGASINDQLSGLGFPVNMGGKSEAVFDITGFMGLMAVQFPGERQEFHLHAKDANGVKDVVLILQF